jgi:peptidoglycan hydrolase-like protein with peptidoglycan-binding domain
MRNKLTAICALAIMPSLVLAQRAGAQGQTGSDTGQAKQTQGQRGQDTVTEAAGGSIATTRNLGLSSEQAKQLQEALNATGCNAGTPDGVVGPVTRKAISCAEQERNLSGNNLNELLRAFGFRFTVDSATAATPATDTTPGTGAVRGTERQTGGENAGRVRPIPDSAARDTSRSQRDTSSMQQDTSSMNTLDTSSVQRDTSSMQMRDTSSMQMRDTSSMQRDTTQRQ